MLGRASICNQFTGDTVDVKVDDDQNNLNLYIDGVHKLTLTRPGRATVALKDLGAGRHIVRLEKTSETQNSTGTFDGFYVMSAEQALPAPHYDRSIEFIGTPSPSAMAIPHAVRPALSMTRATQPIHPRPLRP